MSEPKRYPTLYECKIGQGQKGNCFKWALERVLSKIVYTIAYPPPKTLDEKSEGDFTITFESRVNLDQPIPYEALTNEGLTLSQIKYVYTRIALTQFFGDWITLYCGSEGDISDAYKDIDDKTRVTESDVFTDKSMCGMSRTQSFGNTPEVLLYNFSRIVNCILTQKPGGTLKQTNKLLQMKYPICLGIRDPTIDDINTAYEMFSNRESGRGEGAFYRFSWQYAQNAFNNFFVNLRENKQFLDIKTVTLHRKPYVIYNEDDTQDLVPQIDINVGGVSQVQTNKVPNNYFGDIQEQLDKGLYAELSVYMPDHKSKEYSEGLQTLTEGKELEKTLYKSMTTRSGNIKLKNIMKLMSNELPGNTKDISGHSMALKGIRVDTPEGKDRTGKPLKPQLYIKFINSWDDQQYVEYPANLFFRTDVHALIPVSYLPGHIRSLTSGHIASKYSELSFLVPSCVPEYMLNIVAGDYVEDFRRCQDEGNPQYRVNLANSQNMWNPLLKERCMISPANSPFESPREHGSPLICDITRPSPIKFAWDIESPSTPMEECTPEKCSNLPMYRPDNKRKYDEDKVTETSGKEQRLYNTGYDSGEETEEYDFSTHDDYETDGGAKNKTNKRRLKRVTRKLKKKRATCRLKKCRILKRHTHKKRNNKKNPNHKKKQNKQTKRK